MCREASTFRIFGIAIDIALSVAAILKSAIPQFAAGL